MESRPTDRVEGHLENGGHVVVTVAQSMAGHADPGAELVNTLVRAGPSEADLARAIVDEAGRSGMDCRVSSAGGSTFVEVRAVEDRLQE
jgi:hypothetical protein